MMAESPVTPSQTCNIPLDAESLGAWIREHVFADKEL